MTQIKKYAVTHGGNFHADDVFSASLLKLLNPEISITRTFEVPENYDGIAFDVGRGKFDHHQQDAEVRENGVPYAAFGLLWREFGVSLLSNGYCAPEQAQEEFEHFDESFIQPLDLDDNTGCGNQLAGAISVFNPSWDSNESSDETFFQAVNFASVILSKKLNRIKSAQLAKKLVSEALSHAEGNIVILPKYAPWKKILIPSNAEFVVYPSQRGGYSAQVIPQDFDTKEVKCPFPEEWAGKPAETLQKISGVDTLTFCHKGRFILSADRLDDVIKACRLAHEKHQSE